MKFLPIVFAGISTVLPTRTRAMCQYPLVAKYKGSESTDEASNVTCSIGF
jgi:hypothetical protein